LLRFTFLRRITLIDLESEISDMAIDNLKQIDGILTLRVLNQPAMEV